MTGPRTRYVACALGTIALGLAVHASGDALGPVARDVTGDALWAAMMLWWVSTIAPRAPLGMRAAAALATCWVVEASQLLQTPTLDALRRTTAGRLVLGSGFDPRDLLSYAGGVAAAALLASWASRRARLRVAAG